MGFVKYALLAALALLLAACQPGTAAPAPAGIAITEVDVLILESFPVQVRAVVRAEAPDACWQIDSIEAAREGNDFRLAVLASRTGEACAQVITPLEHAAALDALGLPAGTYTVSVDEVRLASGEAQPVTGVSATFTLDVDNLLGSP